MKSLKTLIVAILLFGAAHLQAQTTVNVNFGKAPDWGPPVAAGQQYYFIPDISTYYDVRTQQYIYVNNGQWVRSKALPPAHRHYNLRTGRTIILTDYHGNAPYSHYKLHKVKYAKGKPNHPPHAKKKGGPGKGHGNGKGGHKHK